MMARDAYEVVDERVAYTVGSASLDDPVSIIRTADGAKLFRKSKFVRERALEICDELNRLAGLLA